MQYPTPAQALVTLCNNALRMRPFTKTERECFAGCETSHPMIGRDETNTYTIVLDGANFMLLHDCDNEGGQLYTVA